jgi:hypothetical protein
MVRAVILIAKAVFSRIVSSNKAVVRHHGHHHGDDCHGVGAQAAAFAMMFECREGNFNREWRTCMTRTHTRNPMREGLLPTLMIL